MLFSSHLAGPVPCSPFLDRHSGHHGMSHRSQQSDSHHAHRTQNHSQEVQPGLHGMELARISHPLYHPPRATPGHKVKLNMICLPRAWPPGASCVWQFPQAHYFSSIYLCWTSSYDAEKIKMRMFSLSQIGPTVTIQNAQTYTSRTLECGPGGQTTWNRSPALPFTGIMTLGKSFNFSIPQFSHT